MPSFNVHLTGIASATVQVDVDDDEVGDLTVEQVAELVIDRAYQQGPPTLCAQCSGWGRPDSLDVPENWETYLVTTKLGGILWDGEKGDVK